MIMNTALTLAIGVALLATIVTASTVHAEQARIVLKQPGRRFRVLGSPPKRHRQQALRAASGDKPRLPPRADAKGMRPDHRPATPSKLSCELQSGLIRPKAQAPPAQASANANPIALIREPPVSDLIVIEFPSEAKAEGVREMLLAMQNEYLIELGDAVVAVKDDRGRVKLNQLFQPVAHGAVSGMLWGSLIGLIFMMPLAGAAIGAASGAFSGRLADLGITDEFMRQAARTLQSGNAALFLLIRNMTTDKVLAALRGAGGTVLRSSFDETKEEALQAALAGARAASVEARG